MNRTIKIASRQSPLALVQVDEVIKELQSKGQVFNFETIKIKTSGDIDTTTALTQSPDDFFTDTIDRAILETQADVGIHSAKDLPQALHPQLKIFALTKGLDDRDAWVGRFAWKDLPPNPRIGTSSVLRQQQILSLRPEAQIINIRGSIQERLDLVKQGRIDGFVVAVCALKRLKLDGEIKDIFPWEGTPLQGQLAIVGRRDDTDLENFFSVIDIRRSYGPVTLVGAGPGDPELLTLKGLKALTHADCVFYDYLLDVSLLHHAPQAEHIYVGKRKGAHSLSQDDLCLMLKEHALAGKRVVRLKGGDPLIFGRGTDEIQYLRAYHIKVDIIPGVSSATGIPSSLAIPLTARGVSSSVAFLSGHEEDEDKSPHKPLRIPQADTLVFLMGLTKLNVIVSSLQEAGWPQETPTVIISNGTKATQQIVKGNLATIEALVKAQDLKPPALIIVGKTVDFYKETDHKTFLHCGTHPEMYGQLGQIISWPMIEINPLILTQTQKDQLRKEVKSADIIVFTSWYAGEYFFKAMEGALVDYKFKTFAVIGSRTKAALEKYGLDAAIISLEETAEGLFKAMTSSLELKGKRVLFPRSSLPNPFLKEALIKQGAHVHEITIYENKKPAKRDLPQVPIDGVIFTSPSTVRNFLLDYDRIPSSWAILAKGPVTLKTLEKAGYLYASSLS